jgi:hypothetical protein
MLLALDAIANRQSSERRQRQQKNGANALVFLSKISDTSLSDTKDWL